MKEGVGFALVFLVGLASIASLLFMSGTSATGSVVGQATIHPPMETTCKHVRCPEHAEAYPLLDNRGMVLYHDEGNPACVCPPR